MIFTGLETFQGRDPLILRRPVHLVAQRPLRHDIIRMLVLLLDVPVEQIGEYYFLLLLLILLFN